MATLLGTSVEVMLVVVGQYGWAICLDVGGFVFVIGDKDYITPGIGRKVLCDPVCFFFGDAHAIDYLGQNDGRNLCVQFAECFRHAGANWDGFKVARLPHIETSVGVTFEKTYNAFQVDIIDKVLLKNFKHHLCISSQPDIWG